MKRINDLESYWMPFTANRDFKKEPRIVCSAEGMYYKSLEGKDILDATAGLWCVNAGFVVPMRFAAVLESRLVNLSNSKSGGEGRGLNYWRGRRRRRSRSCRTSTR